MGNVTTGDPDTPASVTNSGTAQNAVLDFVIPKGCTGSSSTPQALLNAYSTPAQPGSAGNALLFDKNGTTYGSAITHTAGSGDFALTEPGFYQVSYNSAVAPVATATFPSDVSLALQMAGSTVPGTSTRHAFQSASDVGSLAASQVLQATGPTTLSVVGGGNDFLYSDLGISICKLGDS